MQQTTLVTGAAGFIGYHVSQALLARGHQVVGLDNLNDYYSVDLKLARLQRLSDSPSFRFHSADIADAPTVNGIFDTEHPTRVVHLAAQAGVRYSIENPSIYIQSNMVGFGNVIEACRHHAIEHLVYASSSSVYGSNAKMPFSVHDAVDHPVSLYAATKKSNELIAHTYSHLFGLPTTGLRFFTVYGPWGRPDMAPMLFANAITKGETIKVFNSGRMRRDFTYVGDVARGVAEVLDHIPSGVADWNAGTPDPATSSAPYRIYNVGNQEPVNLLRFIELLEQNLGKVADKKFLPLQPGDLIDTYADVDDLVKEIGFKPATPFEEGIRAFANWFRDFYRV